MKEKVKGREQQRVIPQGCPHRGANMAKKKAAKKATKKAAKKATKKKATKKK